jgi:hypothetical protein
MKKESRVTGGAFVLVFLLLMALASLLILLLHGVYDLTTMPTQARSRNKQYNEAYWANFLSEPKKKLRQYCDTLPAEDNAERTDEEPEIEEPEVGLFPLSDQEESCQTRYNHGNEFVDSPCHHERTT